MCSLKVFPVSCQQLRATAKFQLAVAGTLLNFPLPPICSSLLLSWKSSLAKGWSTHAVSLPPFASLHRTLFSFLLPHLTAQVIACYCCSVAKLCPTLVTPWAVADQAPLSMGFPRQEYWSGLPFPSPRNLPGSGIEPTSSALQSDSSPQSR